MENRSRLIKMKVTNFGGIGPDGIEIALDNIVCLVGANNSGKSTVLRAYEAAVNQLELKPTDIHSNPNGQPTSVELWIHIPDGAGNVDEKWKEKDGELLLVRSKWEWPSTGGRPVRRTWNPSILDYSEDDKASGLDNVFNSRLPKPFRIGSLENPEEEHKKLLTLVLEPVSMKLKCLMSEKDSLLCKKLLELQAEAEKPVTEFKKDIEKISTQISKSYKNIFNSSEIKFDVSLGSIGFEPDKSLKEASKVVISEPHAQTRWDQQGTGSQRALFWSMLQVRSELNRISEEKKQQGLAIQKKEKEIIALQKKSPKTDAAKAKNKEEIEKATTELNNLKTSPGGAEKSAEAPFLPGYMLLIDEPETALHPSAVRAAKEHLYALAEEAGWQVMLSTHHPAFVDPLKDHTTIVRLARHDAKKPPCVYRADAMNFSSDEKENLKSLLAFDLSVAEMFFGPKVIIVEGNTEFAAFTEVMNSDTEKFPIEERPLIIRAYGKATIPTLIKILAHFKMNFAVLHDIDSPKISTKKGFKKNSAYSINNDISTAVRNTRGGGAKVSHYCSCPNFEEHHKMELPLKDKPFKSWQIIRTDTAIKTSVKNVLASLCDDCDSSSKPEDGNNFETLLQNWVKTNGITEEVYNFD